MSKISKILVFCFLGLFLINLFFSPSPLQAQELLQNQLQKVGGEIYGEEYTIPAEMEDPAFIPLFIVRIIEIVLGFLSLILVILIIYSGFLWMTAGGNDEQIKKAKSYLKNAVIGLIIIVMSWAITRFVVTRLIVVIAGG